MLVVDLVGLRRMESPEWHLSGFGCSGALVVFLVDGGPEVLDFT